LTSDEVPCGSNKIGTGAPPIKTNKGWLTTFHAVVKHEDKELFAGSPDPWRKEYIAGLLLELDEPWKIIAMSKEPLLQASAPYELEGFRG
jgi:beta-1,4-mannooligosaccharide/beta-1,4-mannosyl-N-acetylglucosamine phosphorylase